MKIRPDQLKTLAADMKSRFEQRMFGHVNQFFPDRCRALNENGTREWIAEGIARAAKYGIVTERDVCKFIDVMFVFGREFDTDPLLPWAKAILSADPVDPSRKMSYLFATAEKLAPPGA